MMTREQAETQVERGFWIHLAAYVLVVAGLAVLNITRNPDKLWVLWVAGGWGIGIAAHAAAFFSQQGREKLVRQATDRMERRESGMQHREPHQDETRMTERMSQPRF
ncbi:MAG: 2TM domain-containing protein [Planctomycetaceae bacterium]|nr:2TM domain-containing protein [Planctomycetaceae bacterium]